MKTSTVKPAAPAWILLDAEGQNLGRLSAKVAHLLRGKHKAGFAPNALHGDHIVVVNVRKLAILTTKFRRKSYARHTGYFGHVKHISLKELMEKKPTEVLTRAVKGMLPGNSLRPKMLKRLHVFADAEHSHAAQKPVAFSLPKQ